MNGNRRGRVLNRRVPDHLLAQRQVPIIPRVSLGLALPRQTLRAPLCRREALDHFRFFRTTLGPVAGRVGLTGFGPFGYAMRRVKLSGFRDRAPE